MAAPMAGLAPIEAPLPRDNRLPEHHREKHVLDPDRGGKPIFGQDHAQKFIAPRGNPTMNVQDRPDTLDMNKYGVGQPVPRTEDPILVQGHGRYTDDLNLPKQAYAAFVRSRHAHGVIKGIDTGTAKGMPGVLAIYTGADLSAYGTMKCVVPFKNRDGSEMKKPK